MADENSKDQDDIQANDPDLDSDDLDLDLEDWDEDDEEEIDISGLEIMTSAPAKNPLKVVVEKAREFISSLAVLRTKVGDSVAATKAFVGGLKSLPREKKIKFAGASSALAVVALLLWQLWTGDYLTKSEEVFLASIYEGADKVFELADEATFESFYNSLRYTQSVFLMEKMVVNLYAEPGVKKNPMAVFEYFIEGSSREVLLEIKARNVEIKDSMQRVLEEFSAEEIASADGKERAAESLKREMNRRLLRGRVKNLYLKTMILK